MPTIPPPTITTSYSFLSPVELQLKKNICINKQ
jgi:hypothetical protein